MKKGYPNAWGARIPVESNWNIQLFDSLLHNYHDREVITWLKYGWPISRPPNIPDPVPVYENHASAVMHPDSIHKYLQKEMERGAICGPFKEVPFNSKVGVSPLSMRPKRDSQERRIITDLSWPEDNSVNDGIAKDQFMGFYAKLTFPSIDTIAKRVAEIGKDAKLFKVDLSSYFRQLPLNPGDYSLLCFTWEKMVYFDLVSPQGLRSAPYFAQRTSNAIRFVHNDAGYYLFNYIDDFIGIENSYNITQSFTSFTKLLQRLGVKESEEKRVPPSKNLNCCHVSRCRKHEVRSLTRKNR